MLLDGEDAVAWGDDVDEVDDERLVVCQMVRIKSVMAFLSLESFGTGKDKNGLK